MKKKRLGLAKRVEKDRNVKGEIAELRFLERVTALGYVACRPFGNNARFDFLVEARGRITRVQVKSSWEQAETGIYHVCCVSGAHYRHRPYVPGEIDFLAAYAAGDDVWYIVPVRKLPSYRTMRVCPRPGRTGRYERYREAWHLLEEGHNSGRVKQIWAMASTSCPQIEEEERGPEVEEQQTA